MEFDSVGSKRDFVKRYQIGEFGNRAPTWDNISEFLQSGWNTGLIHIRNRIAGGETWYDIPCSNVPSVWEKCLRAGCKPSDLYLSAMAPTEKTLIQGEIQQTPVGLSLYHTCVARPMREAIAINSHQDYGIISLELLRHYMCVGSFEWMETLLDRYPGHVLEFSVYDCNWGTIPGRNTIFWEVRSY